MSDYWAEKAKPVRVLEGDAALLHTDPQTPAWLPGIANRVIHSGQSDLMQRMTDAGEDITDTELWKQRREQFMALLADRAAER